MTCSRDPERGLSCRVVLFRRVVGYLTDMSCWVLRWAVVGWVLCTVRGGGVQKFWDETDTMHCVGGTQQLAERLRQSLDQRGERVKLELNCPVESIPTACRKVWNRWR